MDHGDLLFILLLAIIRATTILEAKGVSFILRTLKASFHGNIDMQSDQMEATAIISPKVPPSEF